MSLRHFLFAFHLLAVTVAAQSLDQTALSGRYGFVHLLTNVSTGGQVQNVRNLGGVITFDSTGGYSFQGELGNGAGSGSPITGTGSYSVEQNGFVRLTNPIVGSLILNCRVGIDADALLGASTESESGVHDFFVAVKLGDSADNGLLSGRYTGAAMALPGGSANAAKTAFLTMSPNGQGGFVNFDADGHAADQGETPIAENITTASYSVNADGSGTLQIGGDSVLLAGSRNIYVSANGNYVLGHSSDAGLRDAFVAVRAGDGFANDADFAGDFWAVDLFVNTPASSVESAVGGIRSNGSGTVSIAQRLALTQGSGAGAGDPYRGTLDFSGVNSYGVTATGTGFLRGLPAPGLTNFALGAPAPGAALSVEEVEQLSAAPNAFVGAQVFQTLPSYSVHGITFGIRFPVIESGSGMFLSPIGVLNAASFAPPTAPISGGALLSLFGSELADATIEAGSVPLPTQLGGVTVTVDGVPAPLFFVSPGQINIQTPFGVQGPTATISVSSNGTTSNAVTVPVATSSPGVFSAQQTGYGPGIVTHADFSLVTEQNPAAPGETVIVFMTGGGPLSPTFADGAAGPTNPLSLITDEAFEVRFAGEVGAISFAGAAPGFVGLYQVNVKVPEVIFTGPAVPMTIVTGNAFSDYVDIAVGF